MVSDVAAGVNTQDELWTCYNRLLLGPDLARIRKLLVRSRVFDMVINVPGDIVEAGVYKGAGLMFWAKLLEIFSPSARKRVIGFDVFSSFEEVQLEGEEVDVARRHDSLTRAGETSLATIEAAVSLAGLAHRIELVPGEVESSAPAYARDSSGFRISLLHLDLDTYSGTKSVLESFWPNVSRGGVVLMDEYAVRGMGESKAIDEFFAGTTLRPKVVPFAETPTAYLVKP